jgi:hypothetical protein
MLDDTNEDLLTYVGWYGGLDLTEAGVVLIRQAYHKINKFFKI